MHVTPLTFNITCYQSKNGRIYGSALTDSWAFSKVRLVPRRLTGPAVHHLSRLIMYNETKHNHKGSVIYTCTCRQSGSRLRYSCKKICMASEI